MILKRQLVEVFPRGRHLSPEEEPVSDSKEERKGKIPKKKRKSLPPKEKPLSSGRVEAAGSKTSGSKKKEKFQKLAQEDSNGHFPTQPYKGNHKNP